VFAMFFVYAKILWW